MLGKRRESVAMVMATRQWRALWSHGHIQERWRQRLMRGLFTIFYLKYLFRAKCSLLWRLNVAPSCPMSLGKQILHNAWIHWSVTNTGRSNQRDLCVLDLLNQPWIVFFVCLFFSSKKMQICQRQRNLATNFII